MLPHFVSLNHFRAKVYRSRLALVLLLILLSGSATPPSQPSSAHNAVDQAAISSDTQFSSSQSSAVLLDPSRSSSSPAATSINGLSRAASWVQKYLPIRIPAPSSSPLPPTAPATLLWPSAAAAWRARAWVTALVEQPSDRSPDAPVHSLDDVIDSSDPSPSVNSPARLSVAVLLTPTIFPTLLQLHVLWLVRFIAGEVEGRAAALKHRDLSFWPACTTLTLLASSILGILLPSTTRRLRRLGDQWSSSLSISNATPGSLFPAFPVLLLETIPTLLSLAPLLLALFPRVLPSQLHVISPSHASPLLDLIPLWVKAPFLPAERARARTEAARAGRARRQRGGATDGAVQNAGALNEPTVVLDGAHTTPIGHPDSPSITNAGSLIGSTSSPSLTESARILRLQQDMIDEMERAGRLSPSALEKVRRTVGTSITPYGGKFPLRRVKQRVALPLTYIVSTLLMLSSSLSLIVCYALIGLRLPTLAPTTATALVDMLALRAEIGTLIKDWNRERRRVEGLEFVRRRWGTSTPAGQTQERSVTTGASDTQDQCSICFEVIDWTNEEEDVVKLDCGHKLHAPCLVPWLLSQAFCPVCHRALRPQPAVPTLLRSFDPSDAGGITSVSAEGTPGGPPD